MTGVSVRIDGSYIAIPAEFSESDIERIPRDIRDRFDEILAEATDSDYEALLVLATIAVLHTQPESSWLDAELFIRASTQVTFVA